jgi:hypothetical protein
MHVSLLDFVNKGSRSDYACSCHVSSSCSPLHLTCVAQVISAYEAQGLVVKATSPEFGLIVVQSPYASSAAGTDVQVKKQQVAPLWHRSRQQYTGEGSTAGSITSTPPSFWPNVAEQPVAAASTATAAVAATGQQQIAAVIQQLSSVLGVEQVHKNVQMRLHRNRFKQPTAHTRLWRQLLQRNDSSNVNNSGSSSSKHSHNAVKQAMIESCPQQLVYDTGCGKSSEGETWPATA